MGFSTLLRTLRSDLERHNDPSRGPLAHAMALAGTQAIWATLVYRVGQWVYERPRPLLVGGPAKLGYKLAAKWVEVATGISLPASVRAGPGLYIGHFGTIIVHPRTVMGDRCSVGQGVTIGTRGQGDEGVPVLGDDVYVGAGAKVLGRIQVGDHAAIGANAVVVNDVPPGHIAVGVPARARPRRSPAGDPAPER